MQLVRKFINADYQMMPYRSERLFWSWKIAPNGIPNADGYWNSPPPVSRTIFYQIGFFLVNAIGESLEVHCDSIPVMSSVDCVYLCFYRLFGAPLCINYYTLLVRDLMHRPLLSSCPLGSSTMINILFYRLLVFCS